MLVWKGSGLLKWGPGKLASWWQAFAFLRRFLIIVLWVTWPAPHVLKAGGRELSHTRFVGTQWLLCLEKYSSLFLLEFSSWAICCGKKHLMTQFWGTGEEKNLGNSPDSPRLRVTASVFQVSRQTWWFGHAGHWEVPAFWSNRPAAVITDCGISLVHRSGSGCPQVAPRMVVSA